MLAILEVVLTIVAWRKGWRGWALLPMGILYFVAFWMGMTASALRLSYSEIKMVLVVLSPMEFIAIGVLIWMSVNDRRRIVVEIDEENTEVRVTPPVAV